MEKLNLRSLEARGRPLGTERSVLLPGTQPQEPAADFSADVERARSRRREEAERSERTDERRSSERGDASDRAREARERDGAREEPVGATDHVAAEPALVDPLATATPTSFDLAETAGELPETPLADAPSAPFGSAVEESLADDTVTIQRADTVKGDAHAATAAPEVLPNVSRAAVDMVQGARVTAIASSSEGAAPASDALPEPAPLAEGSAERPLADADVAAETADDEGEPTARALREGREGREGREAPQAATERSAGSNDRAFDVARVTRTQEARAQAAEPAAPARPTPQTLPPERAADILRQVRVHLAPGLRQATVRLEPATLGRVAIRIALREGRATTEVRAEQASTLEALERHVPELRAALEQQGIDAGEFDFGLGFEDGPSFEGGFAPGSARTLRVPGPEAEQRDPSFPDHPSTIDASGVDTYA
jgi:flagellar hook-length control protein FliK